MSDEITKNSTLDKMNQDLKDMENAHKHLQNVTPSGGARKKIGHLAKEMSKAKLLEVPELESFDCENCINKQLINSLREIAEKFSDIEF